MRNDFCSNYLEHSAKGTSWKKKGAKYISRVWKNGKWVYQYKITGKGYKSDAEEEKRKSKDRSDFAKDAKRESDKTSWGAKTMARVYNNSTKKAESYGSKAAEAESNYYTKSLAGITEKTIESGKKTISNFLDSLKPTTTVTVETYGSGNLRSVNKRDLTKSKKK